MVPVLTEEQKQIAATVRDFVRREVIPVAGQLERENRYPFELVERMKELGFFGCIIPQEYGGLGLPFSNYVLVVEEIARGWMSLTGVLNTHLVMGYIINTFGTREQKERLLPPIARGEKRGGLAITEPNAGSDVQAIQTTATPNGTGYTLRGSKVFLTNARYGNTFAVVAKTDPRAQPPYRGISCFVVEKGPPGFIVARDMEKLGYRSVDTCEVFLEDLPVPRENLVGGQEGKGFAQVMAGLEVGRINVAARAVGVAQAAFEAAIRYVQQRTAFGQPISQHQAVQLKLAEMATKVQAAHLLTLAAAAKKDQGERCDVEAGMAKLFASETCLEVAVDAMRLHGGYGYIKDYPVERYYRDAPLMVLGEGTNEIQKLIIARGLLQRYPV